MIFNLRNKEKPPTELQKITESIENLKEEMRHNEALFNLAVSPELLDYSIHKDLALKAQFDHLIKLYRETKENEVKI